MALEIAGQPAAVALSATAIPVALSLLGRFELTSGGRPVPLAAGQASQLVKFVAVSGGRVATERATDAIWPEADLDARDQGPNGKLIAAQAEVHVLRNSIGNTAAIDICGYRSQREAESEGPKPDQGPAGGGLRR